MAMSDTQRGAAIALAFAHSQGRDPEGGLPAPKDNNRIEFEPGSNIQDNTGGFPNIPPQMGPQMPTDDPYQKYRTQQA